MSGAPAGSVLVAVIASDARSVLPVLARVPTDVLGMSVELLVVVEASSDPTFEAAVEAVARPPLCARVLFSRHDRGFGAKQKLAYAYALRERKRYMAVLDGSGQYDPQRVADLVSPLVRDQADVVLGARTTKAAGGGGGAGRGPGSSLLTAVQNALLRCRLSDPRTGFRAIRVATLEVLPFHYNTDGFHFDTQLLIQALGAGLRIVEVPTRAETALPIRGRSGVRHALAVLRTALASRLHTLGTFYDRKFDLLGPGNTHYELKLGYPSSHTMALAAVPPGARVLDIGCGPGHFARELRARGCRITGVDQYPPDDVSVFERFIRWDEEAGPLRVDLRDYDCVLMLDFIEHLKRPEALLESVRRGASDARRRPRVIVTSGNVVFLPVRLQALLGNFNYGRRGILDMTHTRLYTFDTLVRLLQQCGMEVETVRGIPAPFPLALGANRFSRFLVHVNGALLRVARGLLSYQIFLVARPLPELEALLADSVAVGRERRAARREAGG